MITDDDYTPKTQEKTELTGLNTLRWFADRGAGFTLCCGPKHDDPKCGSPGKIPHEQGWQGKPHTLAEASQHLKRGGNVGQLTDDLAHIDFDIFGNVFLERFGYELAPYIARDDPGRLKFLVRLTSIPPDARGLKFKLHERSKHPCVELLYHGNAVVAGTHASGETIRLVNPGGDTPVMTWAQALELIDTWLAILRGDLLGMAEPQEIPAPAEEYTPEPEPPKALNQAAKETSMPVKTVGDLLDEVLRRWTPLQVFEHFGLAANGTQEEKGWIRILGNGGLFVKGAGAAQFWTLTGAAGAANVPGGGAVQAWTWCESGGAHYRATGKEFIDTVKRMAGAAGIMLPAELVTRKAEHSKNGRAKVDFSELLGDEIQPDDPLKPGNWGDLKLTAIEWEWKLWLARGIVTILSAESGIGKSILMLRLAGCYLCGWPWPDGTPFTGERGDVLWCEAEAAQALNLERAKNWGLPVEKILTPIAAEGDFRLTDKAHVQALKVAAAWPNVKLIVIDSISGAYPAIEKSTEDAMPVMKWLAGLARDNNKPIGISHHLRKRGVFDGESVDLDRLRGASAIVQPARLVWAMDTPDPGAKNCKRLSVIKSNLAKYPDPVGLTIGDTGVNFGVAPETPRIETIAEKAMDLLKSLLEREPIPADTVEQEFIQAGMSIASMRRAKDKLGVVSVKTKNGWKWGLPERRVYPMDEVITDD